MQGSVASISSNQFRNFGQFADMPENRQAALESGLGFFELRFQGEKRFNQNIFGFFDALVDRDTNSIRKNMVRYITTWRTERDAKITFQCINQKTGLSVAMMVDDPFWHNRMMMAFNPIYMIYALHTREGQVPGSVIAGEIDCLREICQEKKTQYAAINIFNRTTCADFDEKVVDDYISTKIKPNRPNALRKIRRIAWITRDWVTEIIHNNERNQYGWTNSDDFNRKIKEPTQRLIDQRGISRVIEPHASVSQSQIQDMVMQTIRGMSPEQIRAMLSREETVPAQSAAPVGAEAAFAQARGEPFSPPKEEPEWINNTFFKRLKTDDARKMAKDRGIEGCDVMVRVELANALIADETRRKAEWDAERKRIEVEKPKTPYPAPQEEKENTGEDMVAA